MKKIKMLRGFFLAVFFCGFLMGSQRTAYAEQTAAGIPAQRAASVREGEISVPAATPTLEGEITIPAATSASEPEIAIPVATPASKPEITIPVATPTPEPGLVIPIATKTPEPESTETPKPSKPQDESNPNAGVKSDSNGVLRVHFLNVNHGCATLVECDGKYLLIDGGSIYKYDQRKEQITNKWIGEIAYDYLLNMGIQKIDYVIASHPHADHIGGLVSIFQDYEIGKVYLPNVSWNQIKTKTYYYFLKLMKYRNFLWENPSPGKSFKLGRAKVTFLAPKRSYYTDKNNYSIVVRIVYGKNSFLITGDALKESEAEMILGGYKLKSDVLQVPHHGIAGATSQSTDQLPFLARVKPKYSVISNNTLASWTILKALRMTSDVYTTYGNGHIVMESDGKNITTTVRKGKEPTYYALDILKVENSSKQMCFVGEGGDGSVRVYYRKPAKFKFKGHYGIHSYSKIEYMPVKENETYNPKGNWKEGNTVLVENGFRGRIFVRFLNEQGKYVVTKTKGFAVDEVGMSNFRIVCNKNKKIHAVKIGRKNKKTLICKKKAILHFSAKFGPSGKKRIAYQVVKKGKVFHKNGKWKTGNRLVLKKGFKGCVYVKYIDNCNRVKIRKTSLFKVVK